MKLNTFKFTLLSFFLSVVGSISPASGQQIQQIEQDLASYAAKFLDTVSFEEKLIVNKEFTSLLRKALQRPESFTYPFSSLQSISKLYASDNSFRIITWQLTDLDTESYPPQTLNYYFGLVQRKWTNPGGQTELVVIPLLEMTEIPQDVENRVLDQNSWLGGLYYPARFGPDIPLKNIKYRDPSTGKKVKTPAYLVMGWNGYDGTSNFKFVDVITPDPNDKNRIIFGANIFFFDIVPKYRAVFRYSDNAPFSLNYGYAKWGPGKFFRKRMILYDHLANPGADRRSFGTFSMGPDGSYDALNFYKGGGYLEWHRNVEIAEKYNNKLTQRMLQDQQARERKKLLSAGIPVNNK